MESGLFLIRDLTKVEEGMAEFLWVGVGRDARVVLRVIYLL